MIGFMSVEAQAEVDFDRARRRALVGRVVARLRRECSRLLALGEVGGGIRRTTDVVWALGTSRSRR